MTRDRCEPGYRRLVMAGLLLVMANLACGESDQPVWKYRFEPAAGITAAGQPNAAGLQELAETGYAAVIDLRTAGENRGLDEKAIVENLGMQYESLPIDGPDAINFENAEELDRLLGRFTQPVLIHCSSSNRVGALLALREKTKGATNDDALAFGRSAGLTSLEETVRARLAED